MESAHNSHKGAIGLSVNGRDEMIDAPMLRQVRSHALHRPVMINTTFVVAIGPECHSARNASRVARSALYLINV